MSLFIDRYQKLVRFYVQCAHFFVLFRFLLLENFLQYNNLTNQSTIMISCFALEESQFGGREQFLCKCIVCTIAIDAITM